MRGDVAGTGRMSLTQLVAMCAVYRGERSLEGVFLSAADLDESGTMNLVDIVAEAAMYRRMVMPYPFLLPGVVEKQPGRFAHDVYMGWGTAPLEGYLPQAGSYVRAYPYGDGSARRDNVSVRDIGDGVLSEVSSFAEDGAPWNARTTEYWRDPEANVIRQRWRDDSGQEIGDCKFVRLLGPEMKWNSEWCPALYVDDGLDVRVVEVVSIPTLFTVTTSAGTFRDCVATVFFCETPDNDEVIVEFWAPSIGHVLSLTNDGFDASTESQWGPSDGYRVTMELESIGGMQAPQPDGDLSALAGPSGIKGVRS